MVAWSVPTANIHKSANEPLKTTAGPRMSPDPRTGQSPTKTRPAVTSQNSAQRSEICNMVTRSVLMENNIHVTKRALEASTDACSPENARRSLHVLALAKCIPLIQFHCMVCGMRGQVITTKPPPQHLVSRKWTSSQTDRVRVRFLYIMLRK